MFWDEQMNQSRVDEIGQRFPNPILRNAESITYVAR